MKKVLLDHFESVPEQGENIRLAVVIRLDGNDLLASLNLMYHRFNKAALDSEAKFGQFRINFIDHRDLSQFVLYKAPSSYREPKKTVKYFVKGHKAFQARHDAKQPRLPTPKNILQRPEMGQDPDKIQMRGDIIAELLAEISLWMKKNQNVEEGDHVRLCYLCRKLGHGASCFLSNSHRDTRCPNCCKIGHGKEKCWANPRTSQLPGTRQEKHRESPSYVY